MASTDTKLSPHMQKLKEWASNYTTKDKFPPKLTSDDGVLVASITTRFISYYFTTKVFIKREPHPDELGLDKYGDPCVIPYIRDRLRNEAAVFRFLCEHTTIPVPKCLGLWTENGLVHLKTSFVDNGVELRDVEESRLATAVASVSAQLESDIFPQLRGLRRDTMGSPDSSLPVIPTRRVWDWKGTRVFPPRVVDDKVHEKGYVFCHTDLDRQNIFVDPETFRIVSIIDWETAGFFPEEWELHFWKCTIEERHKLSASVRDRDRAWMGLPSKEVEDQEYEEKRRKRNSEKQRQEGAEKQCHKNETSPIGGSEGKEPKQVIKENKEKERNEGVEEFDRPTPFGSSPGQ